MNPSIRRALLGLVLVAQLAVPASLVIKHEQTRRQGAEWRFQTAPVDPADPFRGKYVRLGYAVQREPIPFADSGMVYMAPGRRVYAELARGDDGFARLVRLHEHRPERVEYLDVLIAARFREDTPPSSAFVQIPFDRYYLPEERAPMVEQEYREASRVAQENTWVEVRVRDGHAAVVGLVLNGTPVSERR